MSAANMRLLPVRYRHLWPVLIRKILVAAGQSIRAADVRGHKLPIRAQHMRAQVPDATEFPVAKCGVGSLVRLFAKEFRSA